MKKKLFDYLVNKHILKFSSIDESFFIYKKLDKRIKLEQNILKLNYLKESPFPPEKTTIVSISEEDNLYLWFYKKDKKRHFPEALLLFRSLIKEYSDGVFIFKDSEISKILVIKEKDLIASFVKKRVTTFDIKLIEEEFLLKSNQTHIVEEKEYKLFLEKSFSSIRFSDFLQVLNISIDFKSLTNRILLDFSLPLLIASILVMVSLFGYYFYIQQKHEKLYTLYKSKQKNVSKIKEEVSKYELSAEVFNSLKSEFTYSNKTVALFAITNEVKEQNMTLFYIRMNEENIEFDVRTMKSKKIPLLTEKLFSLGIFSSVKNSSTQNLPYGKVKATMQAVLKAR